MSINMLLYAQYIINVLLYIINVLLYYIVNTYEHKYVATVYRTIVTINAFTIVLPIWICI